MKKSIQLVALLLTVVMGSCTGGKDKAATEHVVEKPKVKVADVKARPVDQIQEYTATVEAEAKNNIAPSSPVRIDQIFVEVGDRVSGNRIQPYGRTVQGRRCIQIRMGCFENAARRTAHSL